MESVWIVAITGIVAIVPNLVMFYLNGKRKREYRIFDADLKKKEFYREQKIAAIQSFVCQYGKCLDPDYKDEEVGLLLSEASRIMVFVSDEAKTLVSTAVDRLYVNENRYNLEEADIVSMREITKVMRDEMKREFE